MSLLRIYASLNDPALRCRWALLNGNAAPLLGEGHPAALPQRASRVQLVIPAAQVRFTRATLPPSAKRRAGAVLAFAVEEETLGEPEANQVSWLGSAGASEVLAVLDKAGLQRWLDALAAAGIRACEVHCESLLLPLTSEEWSLAWDGKEGFVRSGEFEGMASDCGNRAVPPLALQLMLEEAKLRNAAPSTLALYLSAPDALPDLAAWQRQLGVALRPAGAWDWRSAPAEAGVSLAQERRRWPDFSGMRAQLRPAAWIAGAALAIHALALVGDWTLLAREQRDLRQQMEKRFRADFPDAVAVVDPALQMRRKLAEARHAANQPDSSDFLPMAEKVATALQELPPGSLRIAAYESGRMTLELAAAEEASVRRIVARLNQSGLSVDAAQAATRSPRGTLVLTARAL